jgi:hypothetical protein
VSHKSAAARLLARLCRERDELLAAAALDAETPLPPDATADRGSLCSSRAANLWTVWQPRDGTLAERERLRQEALADLASTSLYPTLAPVLAAAIGAHAALAAALVDGRGTGAEQERHARALAELQAQLPAVLSCADGTRKRRPAARLDGMDEARDKWIFGHCCKGMTYKMIKAELKARIAQQKASGRKRPWGSIGTIQGICRAAERYAKRHGLPRPPRRRKA